MQMNIYDSKLKKNPVAYINYLQSQNRVKKQVEQQDKEKMLNKEKEDAFNIYLQGANEERIDEQRKRENGKKLREKSKKGYSRKKWGDEPRSKHNQSRREIIHTVVYSEHKDHLRSSSLKDSEEKKIQDDIKDSNQNLEKNEIIDLIQEFDPDELWRVLSFINLVIKKNLISIS
ncbi:hypothetical protein SteCoe_7489 [Stentor coeruleus]|uniref:Uncharacterized protein n=1 Tax=Stentor coeruleus TaxID=5963 RepID=A0A1R2CMJ7_9CILI|nr:hypothetical protein SteCoe_7489 [Stentor coeruleus]